MELLDHLAEFFPGGGAFGVDGVGGLGGGVGDGVVAPEVAQWLAGEGVCERAVVFVEFVDGQEFDAGDAEVCEVVESFR